MVFLLDLKEGSPMKWKIGLAFAAAAIGFALEFGLAQASRGPETQTERASGAIGFSVLQPVW